MAKGSVYVATYLLSTSNRNIYLLNTYISIIWMASVQHETVILMFLSANLLKKFELHRLWLFFCLYFTPYIYNI